LTVARGNVWVLGNGNLGDDRSAQHGPIVVQIDERSGELVDVVPLHGDSAADIVVDDEGIWALVFSKADTMEVLRLDLETHGVVARIPVEGIWGQKITSQGGAIWVETKEPHPDYEDTVGGSLLSKIDPASNEVTWTLGSTGFIESFAASDPALWAMTGHRATLIRIDPRTNEILSQMEADRNFDPIAVDREGGIWFSGWTEGEGRTLQRSDPAEGDVVASVGVGGGDDRWYLVAATYDPARDSIWVAHYQDVVTWVDVG